MKQLREALLAEWPDADPQALAVAARCRLPLVQVTPRGLWGRSGQVTLTTAEHWLGRPAGPAPAPDATVLRYLAAFGPASVKDMQTWSGLTRLREAFERLRPQLVTFRDEHGVELFDLPDAPRPDAGHPRAAALPARVRQPAALPRRPHPRGPADLKGRTWQGNQAYRTLLVDGFLAGVWRLEEDALTVEPFGTLTRAQREEVVQEGERMLAAMAGGTDRTTSGSARSYGLRPRTGRQAVGRSVPGASVGPTGFALPASAGSTRCRRPGGVLRGSRPSTQGASIGTKGADGCRWMPRDADG